MQICKIVVSYNILWYYLHMEYKLIRSKRKTISIKIDNLCQIIVHAPKTTTLNQIENCLQKKSKWIQSKLKTVRDNLSKIQHFQNNKLLLFGEEIQVYENIDYYIINGESIKKSNKSLQDVLKKYLQCKAKDYIFPKTQEIANILDVSYFKISLMSAKHVWGSCNKKSHLKFNFKLSMLPKHLIDYVICHELCHILEFNHGKNFWMLLEKLGYKKIDVKKMFSEFNFVLQLF